MVLLFLEQTGINNIEDVRPKTITQFQGWLKDTGRSPATNDMSCIATFFNWMLAECRREASNQSSRVCTIAGRAAVSRDLYHMERSSSAAGISGNGAMHASGLPSLSDWRAGSAPAKYAVSRSTTSTRFNSA